MDDAAAEEKAAPHKEGEETKYWFSSLPETSLEQLVTLTHALADRAVLLRCQIGLWPGRLPGATLGRLASTTGPCRAGL
jgi:hypothetical protein